MNMAESRKKILINYAEALFGTLVLAAGINLFIVPIGLYNGGFVGIAQIIRTILIEHFELSFGNTDIAGIISFILNIPLFLLAYFKISKPFFIRTFICVLFQSICFTIVKIPSTPIIVDPLSACFIGGLVVGVGTGITLRAGASSGGVDIIGVFLTKKYHNFSVGKIAIIVNMFVYGTCLFLFDIEVVIYSVIYTLILSVVIDKVHLQNICMEVMIFTKTDMEKIQSYIRDELQRGSTSWSGIGGYTQENTNIIYAVISKYEYVDLKRHIHELDENAFVVCKEDVGVSGTFAKRI
ncbi:MAG: YitT family protein [Clostridiales bacterium]|nr:YitT family protein [Clostridiales bacterium]